MFDNGRQRRYIVYAYIYIYTHIYGYCNIIHKSQLRRVQSNVRIDLGREKGRLRDEKSAQEIRLKELDARIESETGTIGMMLEGTPGDLFKTLFPIFSAAGALVFS